jgi:hypothetical protein
MHLSILAHFGATGQPSIRARPEVQKLLEESLLYFQCGNNVSIRCIFNYLFYLF